MGQDCWSVHCLIIGSYLVMHCLVYSLECIVCGWLLNSYMYIVAGRAFDRISWWEANPSIKATWRDTTPLENPHFPCKRTLYWGEMYGLLTLVHCLTWGAWYGWLCYFLDATTPATVATVCWSRKDGHQSECSWKKQRCEYIAMISSLKVIFIVHDFFKDFRCIK